MSAFRQKLMEPYLSQLDELDREMELANQLRQLGAEEVAGLPRNMERLKLHRQPGWERQIERMQKKMEPFDLRELIAVRNRLKSLNRLTWRVPAALKIRIQNLLLRLGLLLVWSAIMGLVLAVIYALLRLIWFLA